MDVKATRITLDDGSCIDYSTAIPLYLKLCEDLQSCSSGKSEMKHVGCHVLTNSTSNVVLGMD